MPISQINTNSIASSTGLTTPTIAQINSAASLTPTTFYDNAGVQVGTLCRAWVYFVGSAGGASISASFNVSSVTRTGTGLYTIAFTNSLADGNYSVFITTQAPPGNIDTAYINNSATKNSSGYGICQNSSGTAYDSAMATGVFR